MSTFSVPIKRIRAIEAHPNADAIEFAVIDGYRSIVKKGEFAPGDLVAYIPESSLLPEELLKRLNLWDAEKGCGKLTGKEGNRVKAIKLRGELSQGICYLMPGDARHEGEDVSLLLGITKYEPPIPVSMAGEVFNAGQELTLHFDVENWKSPFPTSCRPVKRWFSPRNCTAPAPWWPCCLSRTRRKKPSARRRTS